MKAPDQQLRYLRMELESCQTMQRFLEKEAHAERIRAELWETAGKAPPPAEGRAALYRAEAFEINARREARFRRMIAEHLAEQDSQTVQPIRASSDDAALFHLLSEVGGRMPGGGQ